MASIIVVDDEEYMCDVLSLMLQEAGHKVQTAMSVAQAKGLLEKGQADLLISDIRMAQSSGIELLMWVQGKHPNLPVILITGVPTAETAEQALRLGAYQYLTKPIEDDELLQVVNRALQFSNFWADKVK